MPSQSHRSTSVPIPMRRPDRVTDSAAGMGNAAMLEQLGLGSNQTQVPLRAGDVAAAEAGLPVYPGYDSPWHQANDALIVEVVMAFNADKGWTPDHPDFLDPAVVKAWALQESGGHPDIFAQGDMMQMNVPGDWAPEKQWYGVQNRHEQLDPRRSLEIALNWAYYKGEITRSRRGDTASAGWYDTQRGTKAFPGYESQFTNWNRALDGYNGGGVENYAAQINRRRDSAS